MTFTPNLTDVILDIHLCALGIFRIVNVINFSYTRTLN
jgi:hypothetical protein